MFYYQVGGSLPKTAQSYVHRKADDILYKSLLQGEFCYILAARQMGKSSLRVKAMEHLQQEGICCGVLDMSLMGTQGITQSQWYASIIRRLIRVFQLPITFCRWWAEHTDLSPIQCLNVFLEEELLGHIQIPIVLFIDEIDTLLHLDFTTDDFLSLIRACYNNRPDNESFERLTFVLIGVATPGDLIENSILTPFNIGQYVPLKGLNSNEAEPLLLGLKPLVQNPEVLFQEVLRWTGGHPFLTQKVCQIVVQSVVHGSQQGSLEESSEKTLIPISKTDLASLIQQEIINDWEEQDRPEHLKPIRDRILHHAVTASRILGLYQQLLNGLSIPIDNSTAQQTLRLSGLVVNQQGQLAIANPIYREVFNHVWVAKQLNNLRPYGSQIEAWMANAQSSEHLLTGLTLKEALAWAETKQLSAMDYRFLAASQKAAKDQVEQTLAHEIEDRERAEFAFQSATQATQILEEIRQRARQQTVFSPRITKWLVAATFAVTGLVGAVRSSGGLQPLDLGMLDRFLRWRSTSAVVPRVLVVTIDEPDIQNIGQFPVPDQTLAHTLRLIDQHQPRFIGLDIYRDLAVEPGHDELVQAFEDIPHLIGIEKIQGTPILPPQPLIETDRVGFADQSLDSDNSVRRALLTMMADEDEMPRKHASEEGRLLYSFPLKLALGYLETEGIVAESLPQNPSYRKVGKTILKPLRSRSGGYSRGTIGGYQIMLNYAGDLPEVSITQVLAGTVPPQMIRDRIVLIGSSASTINDLLRTPYTQQNNGYLPGVMIHAHTITMLLSAALEGRPLLKVWTKPWEALWIFGWVATGALIAARWQRSSGLRLLLVIMAVLVCLVSAYGLFLLGWWIPVVPSAIGCLMAAVIVPVVTARHREQIILQCITHDLAQVMQENPAVGRIAIAYLKQSERQEYHALIDGALTQQTQLEPEQTV